MDRFVKTLLASAAVAVLAFASGCSSQAASTDAQSAGENSAVFTSSEPAQGSANAQAVDNREVAISSEQELSSEPLVNEWDMVLQNCLSDTGAMMGGWWQAEGGPVNTYVSFTDDADTHWAVYSFDPSASDAYTVEETGTITSMDPLLSSIWNEPFIDKKESVVTLSNNVSLRWKQNDPNVLEVVANPNSAQAFSANLHRVTQKPVEFEMAMARTNYSEYERYSEDEVVDMVLQDGKQVLSGTLKAVSFEEWSNAGMAVEPVLSDVLKNDSWAILVLDAPTFIKGREVAGNTMKIRPAKYFLLSRNGNEWLDYMGQHITVLVEADDAFFPSDVEPYEAGAENASVA